MLTSIGAPFVVALGLSLLVVPACRFLALRYGFVARPREDRWHRRPVALFGGVGIASVVFGCALALGVAKQLPVLVITSAVMFVTGVVDDVLSLKPSTKLVAQIALASVLLFFD